MAAEMNVMISTAARVAISHLETTSRLIPFVFVEAWDNAERFGPHGWIHDGSPFDAYGCLAAALSHEPGRTHVMPPAARFTGVPQRSMTRASRFSGICLPKLARKANKSPLLITESQQIPSKRDPAVHCYMHRRVISGNGMPLGAIRRTSRARARFTSYRLNARSIR